MKNYIEGLYIGPGKIEDVSKIPLVAIYANDIDKKSICIITKTAKKYKNIVLNINDRISKDKILLRYKLTKGGARGHIITFSKPQKKEINACLSNTFGFGGHNACIILTKL